MRQHCFFDIIILCFKWRIAVKGILDKKKKERFSFTAKALNSSEQILFHLRSNICCFMKFAVESTKTKSSATSSCIQSSHQNSKRIRAISTFCDFILTQYLDHGKEMYI